MRTTEANMIRLLRTRRGGTASKNTRVTPDRQNPNELLVLLWGNCIASRNIRTEELRISFAGWPSRTTGRRIAALLREFAPTCELYHTARNNPNKWFTVVQPSILQPLYPNP